MDINFQSRLFTKVNKNFKKRVSLDAKKFIINEVDTAVRIGTINRNQKKIAFIGLVAVGVDVAVENNKIFVDKIEIVEGWKKAKKGVGQDLGNCPPNECFFKTIISRENEFSKDFPSYNTLKSE
jgi:hypothetical protein